MYARASRESAVVSPGVLMAWEVSSHDAATMARATRGGGVGRVGSRVRTHAATAFESFHCEVHHPVAVLEAFFADGVDLEEERPAGEGSPASPVDEALAGGGEGVDRGRRGCVGDVGEEGLAELVVGGQECVQLVSELLVEGRPRYACGGRDVGHRRRRIAVLTDDVEDGIEEPLAL